VADVLKLWRWWNLYARGAAWRLDLGRKTVGNVDSLSVRAAAAAMFKLSHATVLLCTLFERVFYYWFVIVYCAIAILPRMMCEVCTATGVVNVFFPTRAAVLPPLHVASMPAAMFNPAR